MSSYTYARPLLYGVLLTVILGTPADSKPEKNQVGVWAYKDKNRQSRVILRANYTYKAWIYNAGWGLFVKTGKYSKSGDLITIVRTLEDGEKGLNYKAYFCTAKDIYKFDGDSLIFLGSTFFLKHKKTGERMSWNSLNQNQPTLTREEVDDGNV